VYFLGFSWFLDFWVCVVKVVFFVNLGSFSGIWVILVVFRFMLFFKGYFSMLFEV